MKPSPHKPNPFLRYRMRCRQTGEAQCFDLRATALDWGASRSLGAYMDYVPRYCDLGAEGFSWDQAQAMAKAAWAFERVELLEERFEAIKAVARAV